MDQTLTWELYVLHTVGVFTNISSNICSPRYTIYDVYQL